MTKRDRERKKRDQETLAHENELLWAALEKHADECVEGEIDEVTGVWKTAGDNFTTQAAKRQIDLLDAWREAVPNLAEDLIRAYDEGHWRNSNGLQSYMRGGSTPSYSGARPRVVTKKGKSLELAAPDSGYLVRLCIAAQGGDSSGILDDLESDIHSRLKGTGRVRLAKCRVCETKFAALCPAHRNKAQKKLKAGNQFPQFPEAA